MSKNATLGSSANFTCNVSGIADVFWYVDGVFYKELTVVARGVSYDYQYDEASESSRSILHVICKEENNNTFIQCWGFHDDQLISSSIVVLRIQGMLLY